MNQVVKQLGVSEEEFRAGLSELNIIDTKMNEREIRSMREKHAPDSFLFSDF